MTDSGGLGELARAVGSRVADRADELATEWLKSLDTTQGDATEGDATAGIPTADMSATAGRLVRGIGGLIAGDGVAAGDDVATTSRALAKQMFNAGVDRPTGMGSLDALADVVLREGEAATGERSDATSHDAFDVARRIHLAVRTVVAALAEGYDDSIAHELKNPLGAAKGAAELLLSGEGVESAEMREQFTELVLRNINRTLALLDKVRGKAAPGTQS